LAGAVVGGDWTFDEINVVRDPGHIVRRASRA
jgi:hypothetical protein